MKERRSSQAIRAMIASRTIRSAPDVLAAWQISSKGVPSRTAADMFTPVDFLRLPAMVLCHRAVVVADPHWRARLEFGQFVRGLFVRAIHLHPLHTTVVHRFAPGFGV